jgi:ferric-dicitrate binding protein FerR (iron transport regulator)
MTSQLNDSGAAAEPPVWQPLARTDEETAPAEELDRAQVRTPLKVQPRRSGSTSALLAIAAVVAVGGMAFAIGRGTAGSADSATTAGAAVDGGQFAGASGRPGFGGAGGGSITGTIVSVSADSFTVKLASGQTVTVATGSSTTYHSQAAGSVSDLAAGVTVQVQTSGGLGGAAIPAASAAAGSGAVPQTGTRTATDVTITSK